MTLSIVAGLATTLWQAHLAHQQRATAERRFNVARELAHYLVFDLQSNLEKIPGSTPLRAEIIDRSLTYLDRPFVQIWANSLRRETFTEKRLPCSNLWPLGARRTRRLASI